MSCSYKSNLLSNLKEIQAANESATGMNEILPGLYIGNLSDSKDPKQLDGFKITHILSIHDGAKKVFKDKKYLLIQAKDSPKQDLTQFFSQSNDFIHAARLRGGHVLVHCLAGVSRSVTLASAYMMSTIELNYQEALQVVRAARNKVNPNLGFQKQLSDFETGTQIHKERKRLREKFQQRQMEKATRHKVIGRVMIVKMESYDSKDDDLTWDDAAKCRELLTQYRTLVEKGQICSGKCENQGANCASGVCRAHLRPASTSFLRRANTARRFNPNLNTTFSSPVTLRKQQQQQHHYQQQQQPGGAANWSPWSVEPQDQLRQFAINSAAIEGGSTTAVAAPQRKSPQIYRVKNEDLRRDFRQ